MEYDDLSKKWKEPDIFLFGEENNEIPHLSYVKGYRNKNEEESPLPPIDMKKIEFNQFE